MKRLTLVVLAMTLFGVALGGTLVRFEPNPADAQDRDADRIALLETQVAALENNYYSLGPWLLPPPVPADQIGYLTTGQSFTADNAFRLVCRIGELNNYYDMTCIRAEFP